MNTIAYLDIIGDRGYEEKISKEFDKYTIFKSLTNLLGYKNKVSAIAICCSDLDMLLDCVKKIRQSEHFFLTPIILEENVDAGKFFPDGFLSDLKKASENVKSVNKLKEELGEINTVRWKSKLLAYLFTRPDLIIKPIASWKSRLYYTYPLLDLFCVNIENYFYWLDDLSSDGFLRVKKLVDKIFCCPFCLSAHMKFTDHCPNCNSINIREEDFLHCFTCGLVAPQSEFLKNDRFVCPRCNSKLRHIGDDYDRPLENMVCNDCNFYFTDSVLEATCMICDKKYPAESLIKRTFYEYKLTDTGRSYIRNNTYDIGHMLSDSNNYLAPQYFYSALDWMMLMQKRYKNDFFSIIGFNFKFVMDDFDYEMLHDFAEHLRRMLRSTDICTRLDENYFWIILSKTDSNSAEIVKERISNVYEKLVENSTDRKLKIISFTSNSENIKDDNSKILIAKLGSEL